MQDTVPQPLSRLPHFVATLLTLVVLSPLTAAHAGSIECWKNSEGVRECGDSVPPEYSQQRIEVINDHGVVVKVREPAKTKEQLAEEARRAKEQREAELRAKEQARQDKVLLDTFGSVKDIALVRDQKITAIQGLINVTRSNIDNLEHNLHQVERRAADLQRAGRPVSQSLLDKMTDIKRQIQEKHAHIAKRRAEQEAIHKEYAAYIMRYKALTSKSD